MEHLRAEQIHITPRRGSSWPLKVSTQQGEFLLKLSGAGQGFAALVAEIIVAEVAEYLGFHVPKRALIFVDAQTILEDGDPEVLELIERSLGLNLGFRYLPHARDLRPEDLQQLSQDDKALIYWLDWFSMNPDRSAKNPNLMLEARGSKTKLWLIDHGAALLFQHNWALLSEDAPKALKPWLAQHIFAGFAPLARAWHEIIRLELKDNLERLISQVPDDFLRPLQGNTTLERRRYAYVAFLLKRLRQDTIDRY
ncbi:MAG: HipA family kinase [Deinococcales bacterium]